MSPKKQQQPQKQQQPPKNARELALYVLERAGISAPVQALLDTRLTGQAFSRQESALATELVYGCLRTQIRINWLLGRFLQAPEKLPPAMRIMLGIGAYEVLYLDRVPDHASVNMTVETVRGRFGQGLSRVANGVLRSLIRLRDDPEEPRSFSPEWFAAHIPDRIQRMSIVYSIPVWILELWINSYGQEKAEALALASSLTPHPCIRVNTARDEWEALRQILCAEGKPLGISGVRFAPGEHPEYLRDYLRQGKLSIQGAGSQLLLEALDAPHWEGTVWDACAGRGGKTLMLMELGIPVLLASDTYFPRLRGLRDDARRLGIGLPPLACMSAASPALPVDLPASLRTILLDVPCSGLGTLARHPDIRLLRTPEQIPDLLQTQKAILSSAWELLPSGGSLVYTTCTCNPAENEHQIRTFLNAHSDAVLCKEWESTPDAFGSDLMFGAVIEKANRSDTH